MSTVFLRFLILFLKFAIDGKRDPEDNFYKICHRATAEPKIVVVMPLIYWVFHLDGTGEICKVREFRKKRF